MDQDTYQSVGSDVYNVTLANGTTAGAFRSWPLKNLLSPPVVQQARSLLKRPDDRVRPFSSHGF